MDKIFQTDLPILNLTIRGVLVYLSILILLRISGKKQMGQLGATEFVAILLISNAVQNSMNGGDNSLTGGLYLALIIIGLSSLISYLTFKSKLARNIFEGVPVLLIHKGKILHKNLESQLMDEGDLRTMLRKQGFHNAIEIDHAILEADGSLSIQGLPSYAHHPKELSNP
jgi:uncharacterized membrane protein YcaP (DUF421 family)